MWTVNIAMAEQGMPEWSWSGHDVLDDCEYKIIDDIGDGDDDPMEREMMLDLTRDALSVVFPGDTNRCLCDAVMDYLLEPACYELVPEDLGGNILSCGCPAESICDCVEETNFSSQFVHHLMARGYVYDETTGRLVPPDE